MAEEMVVMFPFMGQGHIIPYLSLALQLEQRFHYKIIFINTPLNIKKLHSSLPPNSSITLTSLPFCSTDHGLPPDSENSDGLPYSLIGKLFEASFSLKPSFNQLILDLTKQHGRPPLFIIADMFLGWTVEIARELNIFHSIFNSGGAYGMGVYYSMWMNLPHCETQSDDDFMLPDFPEISSIRRSELLNIIKYANGSDPWSRFFRQVLPYWFESDCILLNTIEELDQTGLKYFRRKNRGRPVWPILPAFWKQNNSGVGSIRAQKKSGLDQGKCIEWLNQHPPNSVLYVSFGSGRKFIWVVRPPVEFNITDEFKAEWLPEGYEARIKEQNRGIIVQNWAPQLEILSHESTGAFVSHCGWNSVLESLSHGVPILGWPLAGMEMKNKALKVKEMIKDAICEDEGSKGSSIKTIEEFVGAALRMRT
ncbi:hypothetical protein ACHQM5_018884 [Ranunculus cassubicifolius]